MEGVASLAEAGVTEREAEVLELLADHLTYAEIGGRLFISARTVESHVSSLRRKLGATDRRELARIAAAVRAEDQTAPPIPRIPLPAPLSSFIGRVAERAELAAALDRARLVSAVGPGGVGKTRLALSVAAGTHERYPGGTWYVDLVPVTDPGLVAAATALATRCGDWAGRTAEDALADMFGNRAALLILDNCEHLIDSVARLVEMLLTRCGRLRILVTSRTRLLVPYEHVYEVRGMSLPNDGSDAEHSDAVDLFLDRTAVFGTSERDPDASRPHTDRSATGSPSRERVARICEQLGGLALAIELAASRVAALGLDGVEAALPDQVHLLVGGARLAARHRSLPDLLQWSYRLLDPVEQAVFRRISVFAAPFDADAAAAVVGFEPVPPEVAAIVLASLCEHSMLTPVRAATGTRYRALEPVRQFASREMTAEEGRQTRRRHLGWSMDTASSLDSAVLRDAAWCRLLDDSIDDIRAARSWALTLVSRRSLGEGLGSTIAHLLFTRGRLREAQDAYERAARVDDASSAGRMLECAAAIAKCRVAGEEAARLDRACAAAFERAGDQASASIALARTAEHSVRFSGMYANPPPAGAAAVILERARRMVNADARAATAVLAAEAHLADPGELAASDRAVVRARQAAERVGDAALLSSVLDASTVLHVSRREISQSATVAARRIGPLTSLTDDPRGAFELKDALHMGAFASVGAGDLAMARRLAQQHLELPFTREEGDLAAEDLFTPAALSGDWANALRLAPQYRHRWERSGRPRAPGRGMAPAAVSLIHGLRGEQAARVRWLGILAGIRGVDLAEATTISYGYVFDAILRLQTGHAADALVLLDLGEKNTSNFYDLLFTQWRAALTAEAAVICGLDRAADLVAAAKYSTDGNPIAHTITRRAEAMLIDDRSALVSLAATFGDLSCPYQRARTLVLSGDESKDAADAAMAALGVPPG